ncbi:MAG: hypothetical protein IJO20_05850 [Ruminococcus sp.]|nr:hypothetical protein [Ruminococcus sp.]
MYYLNFYFKELEYDENTIMGVFSAPDNDVFCRFILDINSNTYEIFDSNKPETDISPLPFFWLHKKLKENGKLNRTESRICY